MSGAKIVAVGLMIYPILVGFDYWHAWFARALGS
ncbi:hypothetical protein VRRI112168_00610 [Vreelandella rituensis]